MKKQLQKHVAMIVISIIATFMIQCKKSNSPETTPEIIKAEIKNIDPLQGIAGTLITITGAGLDTVMATTSIKFNDESATIRSLTPTQITVEVPKRATTGKITVTNKGTVMVYPTNFTVKALTVAKFPTAGIFEGIAISNIAADATGNIYYNTNTDTIFKISPSGVISTLAVAGSNTTKLGGISVDAAGNVYTIGTNDFKVYKITSAGVVSVFAGNGVSAHADGLGTGAQFTDPEGMAIDASGNLFVTDVYRVRKITPTGQVSTLAGSATAGKTDGQGTSATFGSYGNLKNIATDAIGNIYVSDGDKGTWSMESKAYYIRKITPAGAVSSIGPMQKQTSQEGSRGPQILPFTSSLAADVTGNLWLPGSSYNTGSTASGGCCTFGPIFMANRSLSSSQFFELTAFTSITLVTINYTGITFDALGNMYVSASVSYGQRFYEPVSKGKTGSLVLKFMIQ